jgi:hypothetical protein
MAGRDLNETFLQAHGVVVGDAAEIVEATDGGQVCARRQWPVGRVGLGRLAGEALAKAGEESLEGAVSLRQGASVSPAELLDQTVLEGFPETLNPALGLR